MFCMLKKKNIYPVYVSKHSSNHEQEVILLIISNGERCVWSNTLATWAMYEEDWHYLAVKK